MIFDNKWWEEFWRDNKTLVFETPWIDGRTGKEVTAIPLAFIRAFENSPEVKE